MAYLGNHDLLTGLHNRNYFEIELEHFAENPTHPIGVIMTNVDGLKKVNDRLGHVAGDDFLRHCAQVLQQCVRAEDVLVRLRGDKFLMMMRVLTGRQ